MIEAVLLFEHYMQHVRRLWFLALYFFAGIFFFGISVLPAHASTVVTVPASIGGSVTWTKANSPYIIQGYGRVSVTGTLTIEPGVVVKFYSNRFTGRSTSLVVSGGGSIIAEGTDAEPIIFTSSYDDTAGGDTNNDGSLTVPLAGDWYGLLFDRDSSRLSHVAVKYAGATRSSVYSLLGSVEIRNGSQARISETSILFGNNYGLVIHNGATPHLSSLSIEDNAAYGIYSTVSSPEVSVTDSVVARNGRGALSVPVDTGLSFVRTTFLDNRPQIVSLNNTATIEHDTRWQYLDGLTYVYMGVSRIMVNSSATLSIDAGVNVKMYRRGGLYVNGSLMANGTIDNPILFTSYADDSVGGDINNDGNATVPAPGDSYGWGGIYFNSASGSLHHVTLRYGGLTSDIFTGITYNFVDRNVIRVQNSTVDIDSVTIDQGFDRGIYVDGASTVRLTTSTIAHVLRGMEVSNFSQLEIHGNSFVSTTYFALRNNTVGLIDARHNWWGDDSGPSLVGRGGAIVGPAGLPATTTVLYDPWIGKRDPVILIPGILGTEMWRGEELLWPDVERMMFDRGDEFMDSLLLDSEGVSVYPDVLAGDIVRSVNALVSTKHVFDTLISTFTNLSYVENQDLFVFPYDWRLDIKTNSDRLATFIQEHTTSTGKVDIVAHSMGGLLTKQYILDHPASSTIDTLVFIGTPHLGAPGSAKTLLFGDNLGVQYVVSFLNEQEIKKISRNMPSIYQLLPSREYVSRSGGYAYDYLLPGVPLHYDQSRDFLEEHDLNSLLLNRADEFHSAQLDTMVFSSDMNVFNISGCRETTIGSVVRRYSDPYRTGNFSQPEHYEYYLGYVPGDATVPLMSSDAPSLPQNHRFYVTSTSHSTMPSQQDIRELVVQLIRYPQTQPTLPTSIVQNSSSCHLRGRQITTHSPVDIHVYDRHGNHVGPNIDGTVDMSIPGVSYDNLDNNKFVFLPDNTSEEYSVELRATATGTFNMRVIDIENSAPVHTVYYNAVPIITQSKARVELVSHTGESGVVLSLDHDGADNYEVIPTTSVLDTTSSLDFIPPVTTVAIVNESTGELISGMTSSSIQVNLSVSDDSSGVLRTEYSLDSGGTWTIYSEPLVIDHEGVRVLYRSIDRAGNMEEARSVIVPVDKTAPEVTVYFDTNTLDFNFVGMDSSSSSVRVEYLSAGPTSTVRLFDDAENSSEIEYTMASTTNNTGYFTRTLRMRAVRERNGEWQALQGNQLLALWMISPTGTLQWVQVSFQTKDGVYVIAKYDAVLNETVWWRKNSGDIREEIGRYSGSRLFNIRIDNINFSFY